MYVQINKHLVLYGTEAEQYRYTLGSVVSHIGQSMDTGHYTASLLQTESDSAGMFVVCDDSIIGVVDA